jgi:hypothetical protein
MRKNKPTVSIASGGPGRYAKDLQRRDLRVKKQTHFMLINARLFLADRASLLARARPMLLLLATLVGEGIR